MAFQELSQIGWMAIHSLMQIALLPVGPHRLLTERNESFAKSHFRRKAERDLGNLGKNDGVAPVFF
jgi:hypothetical protein